MTLSERMVEAAKDVLFQRGIVDTFTVRAALTAALAVAEEAGAGVFVVPKAIPQPDNVSVPKTLTVEAMAHIYNLGRNEAICATLAGRVTL